MVTWRNAFIRAKHEGIDRYYPVDPESLSLNTITQFFHHVDGKYKTAFGVESAVSTDLDISGVLEELATQKAVAQNDLAGWSEVGEQLFQQLIGGLPLNDLIEAIAKGQIESAKSIVHALVEELKAAGLMIAPELFYKDRTVQAATEMTIAISEQRDQRGDVELQQMNSWGEAAQGLLDIIEQIKALEHELRQLHGTVIAKRPEYSTYVSESNIILKNALRTLDSEFLMATSKTDEIPRPQVELLIAAARCAIQDSRDEANHANLSWEEADRLVEERMRPINKRIEELENKHTAARRRLKDRNSDYLSFPLRPYHMQLMKQEHFDGALVLMTDEGWTPLRCRNRLRDYILEAETLRGPRPELPSELTEVIRLSEAAIARIEQGWKEAQAAAAVTAVPPPEIVEKMARSHKRSSSADHLAMIRQLSADDTDVAPIDTVKLEKLYDHMVAVGYPCAGGSAIMSSSATVHSLLGTIVRCSTEFTTHDVNQYEPSLVALMEARKEVDHLPDEATWKEIEQAWRTSSATWIMFKKGRCPNAIKLTLSSEKRSFTLMGTYKLTIKAIREMRA